ncbi:hypothetical protein ACHAPJ_013115 [Fusarium lateritium]
MKFSIAASLLGAANLAAALHPQDAKPTDVAVGQQRPDGSTRVCQYPPPDTLRISDFNEVFETKNGRRAVKSISFTMNSDQIENVKCSGQNPEWEHHVQCNGTRYRFAAMWTDSTTSQPLMILNEYDPGFEFAASPGPSGEHGIPIKCKKAKTGETVCAQKGKEVKFRIS